MTRTPATATMTAFGEVELTFPFDADLVDDLKSEIPARFRAWDKDEKVWRVIGAYAPTAIDLLLEYFPSAEVPDDRPRRMSSSLARTERLPVPPRSPLPPLIVETRSPDHQRPLDPLLAIIACPRCQARYTQPIRVVAASSMTVAKRETMAPELVAVCPNCTSLAVVAFYPAAAPASP
jgi:hypothetical protein